MELRLPKKTLTLWKLRINLAMILLFVIFSYFFHDYSWYLPASLVFICFFEAITFWYLPCLFKNYLIKYIDGAVVVISGVIVKTTHIMPFSRMIYTESLTSPLAKLLGLRAITLKAARSRILIPELPENEVEKFVSALAEGEL